MRHLSLGLFFVFLISHSLDAAQTGARGGAVEFIGRVVAIADGDTLTLLTLDKRQIRIRLAEIDAPERGQPFGTKAKAILSDLCFGKTVTAVQRDIDRNGRIVATVRDGALDINAEMVRQGAAWVYRKYLKDKKLLDIEAEARNVGRGLWALPENQRVPPWEWRQSSRRKKLSFHHAGITT